VCYYSIHTFNGHYRVAFDSPYPLTLILSIPTRQTKTHHPVFELSRRSCPHCTGYTHPLTLTIILGGFEEVFTHQST